MTATRHTIHLDVPDQGTSEPDGPPHLHFVLEGWFSTKEQADEIKTMLDERFWILPDAKRPSVNVHTFQVEGRY